MSIGRRQRARARQTDDGGVERVKLISYARSGKFNRLKKE